MKYRIYVTEADIKNGGRHGAFSCPVSRAMTRKLKEFLPDGETVGVTPGHFNVNHVIFRGVVPAKVLQFVDDFDNHRPVKRFNFTVDLPLGD